MDRASNPTPVPKNQNDHILPFNRYVRKVEHRLWANCSRMCVSCSPPIARSGTMANLATYTDVTNQNTIFRYDQPGRLTQELSPSNPPLAFFTNVYGHLRCPEPAVGHPGTGRHRFQHKKPNTAAFTVAAVLFAQLSLAIALATWKFTVRSARFKMSEISLDVLPSAVQRSTSISRSDN